MTLVQLQYLIALAEHGHFGRAAESCTVSQPTLSVQLQKLEEELGVELVDRSVHPIRMTERGEEVISHARRMLIERDALLRLVSSDGPIEGPLRIGVIPTISPYLLPRVVPRLAADYPAIRLSVEEQTTSRLIDRLRSGGIDAAIIASDEAAPDLVVEELFEDPFVAYVGADHPLRRRKRARIADVEHEEELWLLSEGHCLRDQVMQWCGRSKDATNAPRFESGSLETLRHLVEHVGGVTLLPTLSLPFLSQQESGAVRPFSGTVPVRTVRLVSRKGARRDRLIEALGQVIRKSSGNDAKRGPSHRIS